jgi:TolB-like protein
MITRLIPIFLGWALLAGGCSTTLSGTVKDADLIGANHAAAQALQEKVDGDALLRFNLDRNKPLIAASFVNIDNVQSSSTFGRMLGEQYGSYFTQAGYQVVELKLRHDIFIREQSGELMLSREVRDISFEHNAQAVLVGTYAVGADSVFVTARMVRANDGIIMASYDYRLPIGPDTRSLLRGDRQSR